jgi:RimJ/RimL family protein N-acetyltransferase
MIYLSPITKANCRVAATWRNEFRQSLRTPIMLTEEMQDDFYDRVARDRHSEDRYWEIHKEFDKDFIGLGGLTDWEPENRLAEISLFISPKLHGQGYGRAAVKLLCEEGFNRMGLETILGEAFLCNPNWKFWEKLTDEFMGFKTQLPDRKYWDGGYYPSLYFSWNRSCQWQ